MRTTRGLLATAIVAALAGAAPAAAVAAGDEADADAVPGEVIIRFERTADGPEAAEALDAAGAESDRKLPLGGLRLAEVDGGRAATREAIAELEREPDVAYAEPNFIRSLDTVPNDPFYDELWAFENADDTDIDAAAGWEGATSSGPLQVAVVDDGISYTHPDLAPNVWANPGESGGGRETNGQDDDGNGYVDDVRGWDFADADSDPAPVGADGGHGTHVSGTIGAVGGNGTGVAGVAWHTKLIGLRVFDATGTTTTAKIVSAFRYATRNGADVVNGSFGGGGFSQAELDAVRAAPQSLFVVAAGNDSLNNDADPRYPCGYQAQNLICVAATDESDALAEFSNFGAQTVDLAAPGTDILSTYPETLTPDGYLPYAYMSGTSMATPVTSGAAALVSAGMEGAPAADVAARLRSSVDPVPALAGKVATGGRLNLAAALGGPQALPTEEPSPAPAPPPPPEPEPAPPEEPAPVPVDGADQTPPETEIAAGPAARSHDRTPTFRFASSESPSGFRCSLDRKREKPCASPYRPGRLAPGRHRIAVSAVDPAGNTDPTAATRRFRILG